MISVDVSLITTYDGFLALQHDWNSLLQRSTFSHPQLTWEWFDAAWRRISFPAQLAVVSVRYRGHLVGLAPLMLVEEPIAARGAVTAQRLVWIAYAYPDVVDFIVATRRTEQIIESMWQTISEWQAWDSLQLRNFTSMSSNFIRHKHICDQLFPGCTWTLLNGHPYLPVSGSFDDYFGSLQSKAIRDIDRRYRRLLEAGIKLRFEVDTAWDDQLHQEMICMDRKRAEVTGDRSLLLAEDRADWLAEIRNHYRMRGDWILFLLRDDTDHGRLIAYMSCFQRNRAVYDWIVSYDLDYSEYSVGKLMLKYVLEEVWRRDASLFDFMAGAEEYKLQWKPEVAFLFKLSFIRNERKEMVRRGWSQLKRIVGR